MELEPWDPWREFEKVRAEVDAVLGRFFAKVRQLEGCPPITFFPTTDVVETAEDLRVFLSLPGVVEEDIDIAMEEGLLVVRGERESPYEPGRIRAHLAEWRYGYFERRLPLPPEARPEDLSATFRWGVLSIVIPKGRADGGEAGPASPGG